MRTPALAALLQTVQRLWPGAGVEVVRDRRVDPTALAEFVLLPDARRPRLLLPAHRRGAAGSVVRFSAAARRTEVASRLGAATALRLGGLTALPERIRVHAGASTGDSLADYLARALGQERVTFSLSIGPARVNRKPVLQVFGADGASLGFAKLGDNPVAREHVAAEAQALGRLAQHRFHRLRVPRVLHAGEWDGVLVLVQEELRPSSFAVLRGRQPVPVAAMRELSQAFAAPPAPVSELPWWERSRRLVGTAPDAALRDRFEAAMRALAADRPEPVPVGAWHGDWTAWNMALGSGGELLVWDWERFETGVPDGFDELHYWVCDSTVARGINRDALLAGLREAGADPSSPAQSPAAAYLVAVGSRYLAMSAAPDGELISARAWATLEALEEWLGR